MLRKIVVLFILSLISHLGYSQTQTQLLEKISKHTKNDTVKCNLILHYLDVDRSYDSIYSELTDELKQISENRRSNPVYDVYFAKAVYYSAISAYQYQSKPADDIIHQFKQSLRIFQKHKDYRMIAESYNFIGLCFSLQGNTTQTLKNYRKAIDYFNKCNYLPGKAMVYSNMNGTYFTLGNYQMTALYMFKELKIFEQLKDTDQLADAYNSIGGFYINQKEYAKAKQFLYKSLQLKYETNYQSSLIYSYRFLCQYHTAVNEPDKALYFINKAFKSIDANRNAPYLYYYKAEALLKKKDYAIAKALFLKSLSYEIPEKLQCYNFVSLSNTLIHLQEWNEAESYAIKARTIAQALAFVSKELEANEILYTIYKKKNQSNKALQSLEDVLKNKEQLTKEENQNALLKSEFKFNTEKKEARIKSLRQSNTITSLESKQKTNAIILIVVLILVVGTIAISLFSRFKAKKKSEFLVSQLAYTEQLLEEKQRATESEIKAIKSQMNPHFFYNALNSIQGYVLTGEQQKASESIGLFSELSRAVLESSRSNEIALFDELELLESYLKLETMRMPKIRYSIETAEDLRLYDLFLPPMIVQPIVENSVKHGLANKEEGGLIQLRFSSNDDQLIIEIEDDGIGREAAGKIGSLKKRKGSSFSTEANLNRIELLNESFGLAITQEIVDNFDENGNATGTLIRITIPQNNF